MSDYIFEILLKSIFLLYIIISLHSPTAGQRIYFSKKTKHKRGYTKGNPSTTRVCVGIDQTLKGVSRHKSCFLRPDTGPCRADIIQWYYDVKQKKCYRFFWGGCQGNGNRFETYHECFKNCNLNISHPPLSIPHYCSLSFDYGNCFGYFNRWAWDSAQRTCKRRLYSGCGGNQNNFESLTECVSTCISPPRNTLNRTVKFTTCVPVDVPDIM